jgi:endoglycosylceramidase
MAARFLPWTIWSYYTAAQDPANTPGQGLLLDDTQPGSEANAKQAKLDAIAVPYASAIAGTPISTAFDRSSHTYQLTYSTAAVPGTTLISNATTIFLPARVYPNGFHLTADNATYTVDGRVVTVKARPGAATITVTATF